MIAARSNGVGIADDARNNPTSIRPSIKIAASSISDSMPNTTTYPVSGTPLRLVYVGRIVRTKGLLDALDALALLKLEGLSFTMQVAGSGEDESQVRDAIIRLGLGAEVRLLGPVFGDAKQKLWLDSDALVFPTYFEGLPYSLLESMAAGCVPIISAVGGVPDVMQDGVHGLFVPVHNPVAVANAIRRLADDRVELQRMSLAGRERIREQYTVDRLADRFGEIYKRLSN